MQPEQGETSALEGRMTPQEFDTVYDLHKADIFRFIFHLTGNWAEAEDLFQETWLRVVRYRWLRPGGQDLKPWLLTIVLNLHRDALRRKRVRRMSPGRSWRPSLS